MSRRCIPTLLLLALASLSHGQGTDGPAAHGSADTAVALDWRMRHQPLRATVYSAILPGAGQVYNRKYWKVPIVLGGLGTCYWFIQDNNKEFQRYKTAYLDVVNGREDEFQGRYTASQLRTVADTYQRWRDISYMAFGLVYILNIVDATVDGYFVRFDVSEDLSLRAGPSLDLVARGVPGISLSLAIH
ncbi:MAG TPA: DUF5683 domain-containing protein [Flavobacteriales bacterium]|nr:DUF5683 domain-containing protein [Flavobacteriales bacterium]